MAVIGIDLDGVCYDFADALKRYLQLRGWQGNGFPPPVDWEFYKSWGMSTKQFVEMCDQGVNARVIFETGDPLPGTVEQLQRLRDAGHTLHILTDRSFGKGYGAASRLATYSWLHLRRIPYDRLTFTSDKTSVPTDYMIDDKLENYDALAKTACRPYLLNRPWNQSPPTNRRRVSSLVVFVNCVLHQESRKRVRAAQGGIITTGEVRTTSSTGGQKGVKPARHTLIPSYPLGLLAEHYGKGAEKYDEHQWRLGYEWSKSYDALQRHALAWNSGETIDPETGSNHMTCVMWHAAALLQFSKDYPDFDDRYKPS